jgi:hypothetical protein
LATGLFLFGGLLVGFMAAIGFTGLPMHLPESARTLLAMVIVLGIVGFTSAAWGRAMARLTGASQPRRMIKAGVLSFGPSLILAGFILSSLEVAIVERGSGPPLPVHVVFTILFVPAVFCVAGVGGLALGLAHGDWRLAWRCGLCSGLAGSAAFLLVVLVMDQIGYRVGAPGAAERATMLTVMMTGNLAAALAGGAALGVMLKIGSSSFESRSL